MIKYLVLTMLVVTRLSSLQAADPLQLLQDEVTEVEKSLQTERQNIESARKELLRQIAEQQAAIRQRQGNLTESQARRRLRLQNQESITERADNAKERIGALKRLLASEVAAFVSVGDTLNDIQSAWPDIAQAVTHRLEAFTEDLHAQLKNEAVLDRDGNQQSIPVWRWGAVQGLALGEGHQQRGLLHRLDDGSWMIGGPPIPAASAPQHGLLPVDVVGNLATSIVVDNTPRALFERAGPFAWPILLVACLGLIIIVDRIMLLWRWHAPRDQADRLIAELSKHDTQTVTKSLKKKGNPQSHVLSAALHAGELSAGERTQRTGAALVEAEVRLQRGLRLLAVLAASAPLLGLLGTVTGMIGAFEALDIGAGGNAGQLSAGIGEALLTTEFGLIVAVPLLLAHAVFARDAQRRRAYAESSAMRLLAFFEGQDDTSTPGDSALEPRHAE